MPAACCALRPRRCARALVVAAKRPGLSAEARAHLLDSADSLNQALEAKLNRASA